MSKRFSLGIDLGTTNSAIALTDLESNHTEVLEVTQILGPNQIGEKPTLPSALYIPHREHGVLIPDRLITSAKSWLSNPHIDPKRPSLPWRSEIEDEKLSPFECSRRYLAHLKNAFLYAGPAQGRNWDLSETEIVLTVPASFDAVAQTLTAEAVNGDP